MTKRMVILGYYSDWIQLIVNPCSGKVWNLPAKLWPFHLPLGTENARKSPVRREQDQLIPAQPKCGTFLLSCGPSISLQVQKTQEKEQDQLIPAQPSVNTPCQALCTAVINIMTKSQSPAKKIRSLKRLLTFRMKCRIQHLNNKLVKSNLSICGQASVSIEPQNLQRTYQGTTTFYLE